MSLSEISQIEPSRIMTIAGIALVVGAAVVIVGLNVLHWTLGT